MTHDVPDPLLHLLSRFADEGVRYVLVGGQAVRINGYVRATEDIDVLLEASRDNGERVKREKDVLDKQVLRRIKAQLGPA